MPRILAKAAVFSQMALVAAAIDGRRKRLFEESYVVALVAGPRHHSACLDLGTDHTVVQALVGLGGKDLGQLEHAIGSSTIGIDDAVEVGPILSVQLFSHEATEAASATLMSNKSAALIHGLGRVFAEAAPTLNLFKTGIITINQLNGRVIYQIDDTDIIVIVITFGGSSSSSWALLAIELGNTLDFVQKRSVRNLDPFGLPLGLDEYLEVRLGCLKTLDGGRVFIADVGEDFERTCELVIVLAES